MPILITEPIKSVATFQGGCWVRLFGQYKMYKSRVVFKNAKR